VVWWCFSETATWTGTDAALPGLARNGDTAIHVQHGVLRYASRFKWPLVFIECGIGTARSRLTSPKAAASVDDEVSGVLTWMALPQSDSVPDLWTDPLVPLSCRYICKGDHRRWISIEYSSRAKRGSGRQGRVWFKCYGRVFGVGAKIEANGATIQKCRSEMDSRWLHNKGARIAQHDLSSQCATNQ